MSYEPISKYGNYFVGIDGEGFENPAPSDGYGLLDSSLDDYPLLYTGERLTSEQCLDWLWNLSLHAGYCTFTLFGARYDYDNWLRSALDFENVKRYAGGQMVRVGDYLILHQERFKFELRKVRNEDESKPEFSAERYQYRRISTRGGPRGRTDHIGIQLWDVAPFWQTTFVKAVEMTLKDRATSMDLIRQMKDERGSFLHENIEKVSRYNKAECYNLAQMMVELDNWFYQVGIKPLHYNGPGSAAKAMLRQWMAYLHAGRRIMPEQRQVSKKVREYVFPGVDNQRAMMQHVLSAYAGGLNRQLKIGYHPGDAFQYDIISCHPHGMSQLPCLSHGEWTRTHEFNRRAFGLWKVRYHSRKKMSLYPFFWRASDGTIEYPYAFEERWVHTSELAAALAIDPDGITLLDGWKWNQGICDNPNPFWWVRKVFAERQHYKLIGNEGASNGLKLPLNSLYGSVCQARGGSYVQPPWTQQLLWGGAITANSRTRLQLAYHLNPDAIVHMATDGIISLEPLPIKLGSNLGEWESKELERLTCVQYGVYQAYEKKTGKLIHRERGFRLNSDEEALEFIGNVHRLWSTGKWRSLEVQQRLFVTSKQVAMSEARFDEWCTWKDVTKQIDLDQETIFRSGHVKTLDHIYEVKDTSQSLAVIGKSTPYEPKWGKGEDFPMEWKKEDALQAAMDVA